MQSAIKSCQRFVWTLLLIFTASIAFAQNPNIATFVPYHGVAGTTVEITGSNLLTTTAVTFNGVLGVNLIVLSDSSVKVDIPQNASTGKIKITTSVASYTTSVDFMVDGANGGGGGGGGSDSGGFIDPPAIDPPIGAMTGHPRIFVRQSDVPRLRSWAVSTNSVWNAINKLSKTAKHDMDTGVLNGDDGEGGGNVSLPTESYAELFAFMSLVHPDANTRVDFANRSYTLFMKMINEAAKGVQDNQPFRGHTFAIHNRANWYGESFALTADWIYHKFTAQDKAKIRTVFLRWTQECLRASTTAQEHPQPLGVVNDPALIADKIRVRWSINNYAANHARQIGLMAMALDAADDIPATAADPPAGTLRRFVGNAIGAWLYMVNQFEKTDGAGGISPEGLGYGELSGRAIAFLLLAMHTTGVDNPAVYGAQASMINGDYWHHEIADAYLHMLSPAKVVQESWIGQTYLPYLFGDTAYYKNVDYVRVFGALAIYALNMGDTAQYNKFRWMIDNLPPGGTGARSYRITNALGGSSVTLPIVYYLATDPTTPVATDPRPTVPTDHFAPGLNIVLSRTNWTSKASWFSYRLSWNSIDHQNGDGNSINFYRGKEWLTKAGTGYGFNISSSDYQNTLSIENPGNTNLWFWTVNMAHGSQWMYDPVKDPPTPEYSFDPKYTYVQGDGTDLYNNPLISAMDVLHASRSALYLKPDVVVVYDRASSSTAGRYKRFFLNTETQAVITGNTATTTTPAGQKFYVDALLPVNTSLTATPWASLDGEPAQYEIMKYRIGSEDTSNPMDVRFLNVLQGTDAIGIKAVTSLIISQAGTPFDGALVGNKTILFKRDITTTFNGVTFTVPLTNSVCYVTGLAPYGKYTVKQKKTATGRIFTITVGGVSAADSAGVLHF